MINIDWVYFWEFVMLDSVLIGLVALALFSRSGNQPKTDEHIPEGILEFGPWDPTEHNLRTLADFEDHAHRCSACFAQLGKIQVLKEQVARGLLAKPPALNGDYRHHLPSGF